MRLFYRSALVIGLVAALVSCGKSSTNPSDTTPPAHNANAVNIPATDGYSPNGSSFNPGQLTITAGQSVDFQNSDSGPHNPTADDGSWSLGLAAGNDASHTFPTAGTYSYHCAIHPNMTGEIIVK
jgi:plastocyanin